MPFLVRKINKRGTFESLQTESTEDICADLPTNEFRTKDGKLSTWKIDSLDDLDNAVLAIASTSSKSVLIIMISILSIALDVDAIANTASSR